MTLLPLESWRRYYGFSPWHFNNLSGDKVKVDGCDETVKQYAWQSQNRPSREDITRAISDAEDIILRDVGYAIAPHFAVKSDERYPRFFDHTLMRANSSDASSHWASVDVGEGYVRKVGVETWTLLGTPAVTLSDSDSDGVNDTFTTAPIPTALLGNQIDDIEVYYAAADRLDSDPAGPQWRIAPVKIRQTGGNLIVTGRSWLITSPIKQQVVSVPNLDVQTAANYVTTLDIYRHYTDPNGTTLDTVPAYFTWETAPWPRIALGCCQADSLPFNTQAYDPEAIATMLCRANVRDDGKLGKVYMGAAQFDVNTGLWSGIAWGSCRPPDRVTIRYQAGYPLSGGIYTGATLQAGQVDERWVRIVSRLSASLLGRPIEACGVANRLLSDMQFDVARSSGAADEAYGLTTKTLLECPYGTRRGALLAWKEMERMFLAQGIAL